MYRGTSTSTKVTRLTEDTEYQFRICAINGAGQGPFSDLYKFSTSKAPPPQVKGKGIATFYYVAELVQQVLTSKCLSVS